MPSAFTEEALDLIRSIPRGKVATYGGIAAMAGNPRGARQVVRILHSRSEKEQLPWWRVINREGRIALKPGFGAEEQRALLEAEGVRFSASGQVELSRYLWN